MSYKFGIIGCPLSHSLSKVMQEEAFKSVGLDGVYDVLETQQEDLIQRLKFLKTNKQEESAITNIVDRLILANPDISFKYIVDGRIVYNATQKGLKNKIFVVIEKEQKQFYSFSFLLSDIIGSDFGFCGWGRDAGFFTCFY